MSEEVVELLGRLVRVPSRGGMDPAGPVLAVLRGWFAEEGLPVEDVRDDGGEVVGLAVRIDGAAPRPHYVLDACVDTAPFGDDAA